MKIQGLAIIFVILILPITIIIGEYASVQIETFRLEQLYDSRLITATDDALKAFQINTFNDATSDIADSKINSIEASANAFYNSMESSFGLDGYSKEELQMYVPALVYTMYDGYYIYSPYTNVADLVETEGGNTEGEIDDKYVQQELNINLDSKDIEHGFKPYVYYSCRYQMGTDSDFIINYSLDNYITVQGVIKGEWVCKSGYLLTVTNNTEREEGVGLNNSYGTEEYWYNTIPLYKEGPLKDNLLERNAEGNIISKEYKYIKINGTKYYWDEDENYIFYLMGGDRIKQVTMSSNKELYDLYVERITSNTSAISYYKGAYEFSTWVNQNLSELTLGDAVTGVQLSGNANDKIFNNYHIEYAGSNFNLHRKEVIRYSIESNLSVAIANFNSYTNSGANFQMPKLKENEWELLESEISIISFLQGLNIGGKIYNGYTVVTNDKTEEVVKEERIYITTDENNDGVADYYHKINDKHLEDINKNGIQDSRENLRDVISTVTGVLDLDFEIRKDGATGQSYTYRSQLGCYTSIVGQENVNNNYDSIYEYLKKNKKINTQVKTIYYIALARERWGTYKVENTSNIEQILRNMPEI